MDIDKTIEKYLSEASEAQIASLKKKIVNQQGKIKQMEAKMKGLKGEQLEKARQAVKKEREKLVDWKDDYENTDGAGYMGNDPEKLAGGSKHTKYHSGSI